MSGNPIYRDPRWKTIRRQVLEEEPVCHWCHTRPSTQADHVIELDRGGEPFDRANLVGSCAGCNAARGARHVNRKTAQRIQARRDATATPDLSFHENTITPSPSLAKPPRTKPNQRETGKTGLDAVLVGRIEPRLETPVRAGESYGPQVAAWAKRILDVELMPWQVRALDGMLAHDDGRLAHREAVCSCARQQGKSVMLTALAGWWATEGAAHWRKPQTVLLVANLKRRAMGVFRSLARALEDRVECKIRWQNGDETITFPDGSTISVGVAGADQHGASIDLLLVDELWDIKPNVLFDAFRPSQIARPMPLLAMFSTAGDQSSTTMIKLREQSLATIDRGEPSGLYWCEWSPPPGIDPNAREYWPWANPALGTTVTMDALELAYATPDRMAFMRAHLNLWVSAAQAWLPLGRWDAGLTDRQLPAGGWLALENSLDDARFVGVRAGMVDGKVVTDVAFMVETEAEVWPAVVELMHDPQLQLSVPPNLEPHLPPDLRRRSIISGYRELKPMTPLVRMMILEGRVLHHGNVAMAEHVARAVMVKLPDGAPLSTQKSPGPIEIARAMVVAVGNASKPTRSNKAAFASAG